MNALAEVLAYVAVIVIGQILRLNGTFPRDAVRPMSMLVLYVTLPCSVIVFLSGVELSSDLLIPFFVGLLSNWALIALAILLTRKTAQRTGDPNLVPFSMLNFSGYNVGTFAMPFTMGIVSPVGFLSICLFDVGNAVMVTGGTYAIAVRDAKAGWRERLRSIGLRLASSSCLWTYAFVLALAFMEVVLPRPILHFCEVVGKANPFLAMLLIGLSVNLRIDWQKFRPLIGLLVWRYVGNIVLAAAAYFLLPVAEEIRKALALVLMAPMPAMGVIFTMKAKLDWETAANLNSVSVIVSVMLMTAIIAFL